MIPIIITPNVLMTISEIIVNEYTKFDESVKTDLIKREVDDRASERNEQKRL